MKKIPIVIALALITVMFNGCAYLLVQYVAEKVVGGIVDAIGDAIWEGAVAGPKRKRTLEGKDNPFGTEVETRLLRRTSTLADGTPVNITPYLLHDDSFQMAEDTETIQRSEDLIDIRSTKDLNYLFEYVVNINFEANKQPYQLDINVAVIEADTKKAQKFVDKEIWKPIANRYELNIKDIKKRKLKFDTPLTRISGFPFSYKSLLISEIQPCYYQFDVEVEYQKTKNTLRKTTPEDFATFNKVYRSDFRNLTAAAIDVQAAIWTDSHKVGFSDGPMPRVNFVKVVRSEK